MSAAHGWLKQTSPVSPLKTPRAEPTSNTYTSNCSHAHTGRHTQRPAHFICSSTHTHCLVPIGQLGVQQVGRGAFLGGWRVGIRPCFTPREKESAFYCIDSITVWYLIEGRTGPFSGCDNMLKRGTTTNREHFFCKCQKTNSGHRDTVVLEIESRCRLFFVYLFDNWSSAADRALAVSWLWGNHILTLYCACVILLCPNTWAVLTSVIYTQLLKPSLSASPPNVFLHPTLCMLLVSLWCGTDSWAVLSIIVIRKYANKGTLQLSSRQKYPWQTPIKLSLRLVVKEHPT